MLFADHFQGRLSNILVVVILDPCMGTFTLKDSKIEWLVDKFGLKKMSFLEVSVMDSVAIVENSSKVLAWFKSFELAYNFATVE